MFLCTNLGKTAAKLETTVWDIFYHETIGYIFMFPAVFVATEQGKPKHDFFFFYNPNKVYNCGLT